MNAFQLKILACIFMAVDHVGVTLFPHITWLRLIGRLAFPIFAYFIAEGCIYTKNKPKRLITIGVLGIVCEAAYILYTGDFYGNILLTFTLSIILIYCMQHLKSVWGTGDIPKIVLRAFIFVIALGAAYVISRKIGVDYDFAGVLLPVFVAVFDDKDARDLRLAMFCTGLLIVILHMGIYNIQVWSLLSIPFIALYNGKAGTRKFKYGFYVFYPLHLVIIELINMIMRSQNV